MHATRFKCSQSLVVDTIEFSEVLDYDAIGVAVVDCDIVAYAVAYGAPGQWDSILGQHVASIFYVAPIAQLKGDVMDL